jgi:hypothetical protein
MGDWICSNCDKPITIVEADRNKDMCSDCYHITLFGKSEWVKPKFVVMSVTPSEKMEDCFSVNIAVEELGVVEMIIGKDDEGFIGVLDITCELDSYLRYRAIRDIDSVIEDCTSVSQAITLLQIASAA